MDSQPLHRAKVVHFSFNSPSASRLLPRHAGAGGMTNWRARNRFPQAVSDRSETLTRQHPIRGQRSLINGKRSTEAAARKKPSARSTETARQAMPVLESRPR